MTFYVDLRLGSQQDELKRPGDTVYVKHGLPNSWADGSSVLLGEDCIDFDLTLLSIGRHPRLLVKHVPPKASCIRTPADWMKEPVSVHPNNWVQIVKEKESRYVASVGHETFDVIIKIDARGAILSARMDNPVLVRERVCTDKALSDCKPATTYEIRRQIRLTRNDK